MYQVKGLIWEAVCHCIPTYLINYVQRLTLSLSLIRIALEQKHKAENIPAGDKIPVSTVVIVVPRLYTMTSQSIPRHHLNFKWVTVWKETTTLSETMCAYTCHYNCTHTKFWYLSNEGRHPSASINNSWKLYTMNNYWYRRLLGSIGKTGNKCFVIAESQDRWECQPRNYNLQR
mgnify:CR=1 FL=1